MKKLLAGVLLSLFIISTVFGASQTFQGSITGNAATVTTNANLTGPITSTGNATAITESNAHKAVTLNPGTEKITNGNMETWSDATTPGTWIKALSGAGSIDREGTTKHSGTYSLKSTMAAGGNAAFSQPVLISAGHLYMLDFWVYGNGAQSFNAQLVSPTQVLWSTTVAAAWTHFQIVFLAADASTSIKFEPSSNAAYSYYFDDISVTELPIVINGDAYLTGNVRVAIPTFANNAAAIAGGLVAGQLYRVNAATDPEPLYVVH